MSRAADARDPGGSWNPSESPFHPSVASRRRSKTTTGCPPRRAACVRRTVRSSVILAAETSLELSIAEILPSKASSRRSVSSRYAHHLMSSGDYPWFGLSWSLNGATWHIDPRPLGYEAHLLTGMTPAPRVEWNTTSIVVWQGQEWWVGMLSNFTSGATPKNALIGAAPVTPELRHLIGGPRVVWAAGASWETPNRRAAAGLLPMR